MPPSLPNLNLENENAGSATTATKGGLDVLSAERSVRGNNDVVSQELLLRLGLLLVGSVIDDHTEPDRLGLDLGRPLLDQRERPARSFSEEFRTVEGATYTTMRLVLISGSVERRLAMMARV